MDKAEDNQHLHFTAEIWKNDMNLPQSTKNEKVQIVAKNKLLFLDMKMSWLPKGDLKFEVFSKKEQKSNYFGK